MGVIAVILAGAVVAAGVLTIITALVPARAEVERVVKVPVDARRLALRAIVAVVIAVVVLAATRWVLPSLACGAIGWWVAGMYTDRDRSAPGELERVEALATWTEQLRDVLMAGDQPIGAIQATVATCPEPVRPQVRALASRLGRQSEQVVLRQFADDLDDPTADLIAAGLLVALTKGGRAERVLSALAAQARHQAERRKLLEAEREPARREVWWVTGLMTAQLVGGLVFARSSYLAPYRTITGQTVLCLLLAAFGGLIVYVQRLSRFTRPARFLSLKGLR
ncbi:MAG: type II secretion system F family protein [Acidimicrobiia bacterium]